MKHLWLLFLLPSFIHAQEYVPFISTSDSSDTWMDLYSCQDFECYESWKHVYTVSGDTTIDNLQYAKLNIFSEYEVGSVSSDWCSETLFHYEHYYGAIRESGKKVYLRQDGAPEDMLVYDFNLSIGDTLPSPDGFENGVYSDRIITDIDSIMAFGSYRKRFVVNNVKYVVEGIGSSTGLFNTFTFDPTYCAVIMLCYSEEDTPDVFLLDCNIDLNVNELLYSESNATLVKVVDYLGRETEPIPNTPLIYIYSDGSTRKVIITE
ncbi:MAG: hypothetical protein HRT74_11055 [Flavobacteriales bacterium]|nr:hypothetical protein [Flavobacteriales bacterium]